ncbi:MAG: FtsX-like permease family protein [Treponema sp.]|jgi:ABC-type lipoprotein release transport system permease subunit|nr:FtsX-like permease family protein [Treponema sp.]
MKGFVELKRIALRNLGRHKVKTLLTCAAITISVGVYIWMDSWLGGVFMESQRNIINYEMGAAKLQTKLYFDKHDEMPSYENFAGWESYAAVLDAAGYNVAPRYAFSGTMYSTTGSAPLVINAVDPSAEAKTLAYTGYVELGRYIQDGEFGIALGAQTADKLKVGIPTRPTTQELDDLIAITAQNSADEAFIRSCYHQIETKAQFKETQTYTEDRAKNRVALRRDISKADADKLWALFDATGRNDIRVSTVIDYKLAPEQIHKDKWNAELWPLLSPAEQQLLGEVYEFDEPTGSYLLAEQDEAKQNDALQAMVRADFSGALRHVNQVIDAKVVGMINSPDPFNNFNIGYMPLDVLQDESGMMLEGHVTELLIRDKALGVADMTSTIESAGAIRAALDAGLAAQGKQLPEELDVRFWRDYVSDYLSYEALEKGSSQIFSLLLFFLALIGISNTILLAILERTKETGMMRALGMTDSQILLVYMMEAAAMGLIGSILGIILGCALNVPMVNTGINFSEMMEQMNGSMGYRIAGNFRGMWRPGTIIGSGIVATLVSSLMAILPTRRATKMAITESLRFE